MISHTASLEMGHGVDKNIVDQHGFKPTIVIESFAMLVLRPVVIATMRNRGAEVVEVQ